MARKLKELPYPVDHAEYTAKVTEIAEIEGTGKSEALRRCIDEKYDRVKGGINLKVGIEVKSNITGFTVAGEYTFRELLDLSEEDIVDQLTQCDCEPVGETYVVECNCCDMWEDYKFIILEDK